MRDAAASTDPCCLLQDGSIVIWDVGSWDPLKTLKGHKGAVIDLSIHPSGKLALSVGRDKTLYTWNLLKGRSAFAINFKQTPTAVRWFDAGQRYAVALERTVQLYSTATGKVYRELELPSKVLDLTFGGSGEGWVAVGSNDDTIRLFNAVTGEVTCADTPMDTRGRGPRAAFAIFLRLLFLNSVSSFSAPHP